MSSPSLPSEAGLLLCTVDCGGAHYWVAAREVDDCRALIEACEGVSVEDEHGEISARVATYAELCLTRLRDEDGDRLGPGSLAEAFLGMTAPGVIACSEWP